VNDPVAVALKFGFLAVLYLFLLWVARSSLRDLTGRRAATADEGESIAPDDLRRGGYEPAVAGNPRLEVVAAMGREPGEVLYLDGDATMGRAASAQVRVDDPYASSAHARIFRREQFMYIEDMGSTNGTFLNGRQLEGAQRLHPTDTIRIGESEYRYRE
jgi:FHA domain